MSSQNARRRNHQKDNERLVVESASTITLTGCLTALGIKATLDRAATWPSRSAGSLYPQGPRQSLAQPIERELREA